MVNLSICFFLFPWQPRIPQTQGRHERRIMVQQRNSEKVFGFVWHECNWEVGVGGGGKRSFCFCKHIVCIYIYINIYVINLYTYIYVCILFRKDLYMIENSHRTSYAWDVHGPMFLKLNPLHQETTHTLQTSFTSGSLSINASRQRNGEMDSWTIGVPGPAFEKW